MSKFFQLEIVTPQGLIFSQEIASLVVPSELGYLGVLADHAPLAANLTKGKITLTDNARRTTTLQAQGRGFIEVLKNKVMLLLDSPVNIP